MEAFGNGGTTHAAAHLQAKKISCKQGKPSPWVPPPDNETLDWVVLLERGYPKANKNKK